jgi:hypothetical protein
MRIYKRFFKKGLKSGLVSLMLLTAVILILSANDSAAVGLSVTKASMNFDGVLKGGYAEDIVYVGTDSDFDIPLSYETIGDVGPWIQFDPDLNSSNITVFINKDSVQALKIIIQPPEDTATGNYTGGVRIITGTINRPEGPYGSQLQAAFLIRIRVEVTGEERLSCNIGGVNIRDTEIGAPLEFSMTVANNGNVRIRPSASIDFWNQDQTRIVSTKTSNFNNLEVLPTTSRVMSSVFENTLRIGQYWAYITVQPCDRSQLVSFSVVEKGAIIDSGDLIRIENKPWASIGEIVPITAFFRNTGPRIVSAKFKGVILRDNSLVENIDSDFYDVQPGEIINITEYFTPKKLGQYYISGRILYNNKLTFEKSSILNVNEGVESQGFNLTYALIIIIVAIVILLLLIIRKKKREMHHR